MTEQMRIFQSALPRGERPIPRESSLIGILFQSALPRGERLYNTDPDRALENFNPRSHEGSDVLNDALSFEQNQKSYLHEYAHIINGDYDRKCSVDMIEIGAHK